MYGINLVFLWLHFYLRIKLTGYTDNNLGLLQNIVLFFTLEVFYFFNGKYFNMLFSFFLRVHNHIFPFPTKKIHVRFLILHVISKKSVKSKLKMLCPSILRLFKKNVFSVSQLSFNISIFLMAATLHILCDKGVKNYDWFSVLTKSKIYWRRHRKQLRNRKKLINSCLDN